MAYLLQKTCFLDRPISKNCLTIDIFARHQSPRPAVVTGVPMVAKHVVMPFPYSHRWIRICVLITSRNVSLFNQLAIDINLTVANRDDISGHAEHTLDEGFARILRIPEDDDVSSVDLLKVIDKLVDEDSFLIEQLWLHTRAFHFHWLVQEDHHQEGNDHSQQDVLQPPSEFSEDSKR